MKNNFIKIRVTTLEKELIKRISEESGITISELIRATILGYKITPKLSEEELECYKILVKYADNFRRISNHFKEKDFKLIKTETLKTSNLIREHLKKFI